MTPVKLHCPSCGTVTSHRYGREQKTPSGDYAQIYVCIACGHDRRYGLRTESNGLRMRGRDWN